MVAAAEKDEEAGSPAYHDDHMGAIFKEGFSFSGFERDFLALNLGTGKFLDVSGCSGIDSISDGRGAVYADLDNDGDLDVFLTTAQGEAHLLFRNNVGSENRSIRVEVEGRASGRDAFGAVVRVKTPEGVRMKLKAGGSGFLSQSDPRLLFGLGAAERAEWVEVTWPGGATQRVENVSAGTTIRIVEGESRPALVAERRFRLADPLGPAEARLAALGLAKGKPFPDLALATLDGAKGSLKGRLVRGRKTLVNVWATWCVPCGREMPELERLRARLAEAGIDLVGVSVDLDTVENVPAYVRERNITYPIYTTEEAALEALYPRGEATVPLTLLLDGDGRILEIHSGWNDASERSLRDLMTRKGG